MQTKWYHNRLWVLLMLFVVMGAFGLPLLWKSPRFSTHWKWVLTVLAVIYTVAILGSLLVAVQTSMRSLSSMGLSL